VLLGGRVVHTGGQDRLLVAPFRAQPTPSHTLLDVFVTWQVVPDLRINARIDNITNQTYRRHMSLINQPGRSVKFQASYH